ncbi:beta-hydroxyacyl-ACP dehydratase [Solihabitans fulvus]|uniref:Beta-hydroxyacyl-ACP dehydratase n=1 Tax=Solihabitans fulvus TaxID=1892852 RepID=A0A5B2WVE2_9PSEU|nr:3-hydroxyacyl-ACP dehydratase FabZ family protein [Solihabitans fulvus]KAA2254446.1 beta-hydroxyacyl-ACP dehydratase [Solihabitans fulvus]
MAASTVRAFAAPLDAVDRIEDRAAGVIEAVKDIVADDPYLGGHYPDFTIYPGVFTIETVYQAARRAIEERGGPGTRAEIAAIASVRFSAPLLPGDVLRATCELTDLDPSRVRVKARCRRGDGRTSAQLTLELLVHKENADA